MHNNHRYLGMKDFRFFYIAKNKLICIFFRGLKIRNQEKLHFFESTTVN
jgi:hypothetical protein